MLSGGLREPSLVLLEKLHSQLEKVRLGNNPDQPAPLFHHRQPYFFSNIIRAAVRTSVSGDTVETSERMISEIGISFAGGRPGLESSA